MDGTFHERILPARVASPGAPPLLVMLHGIGADECDLRPLARFLDPRLVVASLRAPHGYGAGYSWFPIAFRRDGEVVPDVAAARASLDAAVAWLAAAPARLGTDPARTYLLGFSQGAMMSLGVLVTAPDRLRGVIALSGRFAPTLFEAAAPADAVARIPVLVAHGLYDDVLPVTHGRGVRATLASRTTDLTYQEFPIGHEISPDEVDLIARWLAARL
jgi:phospholipase/carboxylesterase